MERTADRVVVPDVIGMPFQLGRDLAHDAGVTLANPDPDGPPIGALAWPGLFYIISQHPAAGTEMHRWGSVNIEVVAQGDADATTRAPYPNKPPADSAHAHPMIDSYVDVTGAEGGAARQELPLEP